MKEVLFICGSYMLSKTGSYHKEEFLNSYLLRTAMVIYLQLGITI